MLRPIYYDTETTGLKPSADKIIELAAYDPLNDQKFCTLINPQIPIPKESQEICHIDDAMVQNAPTFAQIAPDFIAFCQDNAVLIAHNNDAFDKLFLQEEFAAAHISIPSWKYIDTLKWARKYRRDLPKHSLQYLREVYGIEENTAHRALDDVITLYKVFSKMIGDLTMESILELLQSSSILTHMPFGKHQGMPLKELPKNYIIWLSKNGAFDKNQSLKESLNKLGLLEGLPS
ncbi:MAG: DUF3820 family protein [Parachlamydiales bacterium]|nr:DUF3820 family protein [Parachlamydiales bacterium]